jgi:4,5-dihydroxyphthalate decarboxylase
MTTPRSIEIPITAMRFDIMLPLLEGRVETSGITFRQHQGLSPMVFQDTPSYRTGDFGLADFNIGYLLPAIEAGWQIKALPVPSKRKSALQFIWVRTDRGIDNPADLNGKLVATATYSTAVTIFVRGFLKHRYGVDTSSLRWLVNAKDFFPLHDESAQVEVAAGRKNPVDRLIEGEVDAIVTDVSDGKAWETLEANPDIKLLFSNYQSEDFKIYKETGIYPPTHMIVMSRKLDEENPGLARQLYDAFERSKQTAYEEALNDRAGFSVLYQREITFEQREKWGDPFAYGVEANRAMLETFFDYNFQQGNASRRLSIEEVFAASTLDT